MSCFVSLHRSEVNSLFFRGQILNVDSSPSHGSILLSPNKKTLVWSVGESCVANVELILLLYMILE